MNTFKQQSQEHYIDLFENRPTDIPFVETKDLQLKSLVDFMSCLDYKLELSNKQHKFPIFLHKEGHSVDFYTAQYLHNTTDYTVNYSHLCNNTKVIVDIKNYGTTLCYLESWMKAQNAKIVQTTYLQYTKKLKDFKVHKHIIKFAPTFNFGN